MVSNHKAMRSLLENLSNFPRTRSHKLHRLSETHTVQLPPARILSGDIFMLRNIVRTGGSLALILLATARLAHAGGFVTPAPEDLIIYQVFIDRFENGDPSNDSANPRSPKNPTSGTGFHGGDLEGIRQRLPYIRGLGANGLWITPFVENVNNYHGYAAYNWYNVEPNFGTLAKLQQLVSEANDAGIAVYFDMVAGHQGDLINSSSPGYPSYIAPPGGYTLRWKNSLHYPAPFDSLTYFHNNGQIGNYVAPEQEIGELSSLDDLKTETAYVREQMTAIWTYWLTQTHASGFRVDTVKHVDKGMWEYMLPQLRATSQSLGNDNFYTFGEVYGADDGYMRNYVGTLDSGSVYKFDAALDFQYYYASNDVFARADTRTQRYVDRIQGRASALGVHHLKTPNFIDNHDVPHFLNVAQDNPGAGLTEQLGRLSLALTCLLTSPGPPVIYQGTEQDFNGGNDPANREDMFDGEYEFGPSLGNNFDMNAAHYRMVARLATLRKNLAPLRRGNFVALQSTITGPGVLAFSRQLAGEEAVVVLNTSTTTKNVNSLPTLWPDGTVLEDFFDPSQSITVAAGKIPARSIEGQGATIWLRPADIPPIPAEIASISPADNETGISVSSSITIRFTEPMDRASVEAATTITPTVAVAGEWSKDDTVFTLRPTLPLVARTNYTVRVTTAAKTRGDVPLVFEGLATWQTGRDLMTLPVLPSPFPELPQTTRSITANGDASDWPSASVVAVDSGAITSDHVFIWRDATGDDTGAGSYVYPSNANFSGTDADLRVFAVAHDANNIHFLTQVGPVNPEASFFTVYLGIALNTTEGGSARPLGIDTSDGSFGITDLEVRPDLAPEFEIDFTGPRGVFLTDANGNELSGATGAFSQATGNIEITVPKAALGLGGTLTNHPLDIIVYTALETFGGVREIESSDADYIPGGGSTLLTDPNVFDMAGSTEFGQMLDLSDFDSGVRAMVFRNVLQLRLSDEATEAKDAWLLF